MSTKQLISAAEFLEMMDISVSTGVFLNAVELHFDPSTRACCAAKIGARKGLKLVEGFEILKAALNEIEPKQLLLGNLETHRVISNGQLEMTALEYK